MLAILFPHMYFYEDYMDTSEDNAIGGLTTPFGPSSQFTTMANAVAGPSYVNGLKL